MSAQPAYAGRAGLTVASVDLVELSEAECWDRLASERLGRIAIVIDGVPRVFPVNHAVLPGRVVFRTGDGAKLRHGRHSIACFEADAHHPASFEGWSVMVTGRLEEVEDSPALRALLLEADAPGLRLHWLVLWADEITGRQFRTGWRR